MKEPKLYLLERTIGDSTFTVHLPAASRADAEEAAKAINAVLLGDNIHVRSCIPASQLMEFCNACADEQIRWKYNAEEQLEAFLSMSWPEHPEEI